MSSEAGFKAPSKDKPKQLHVGPQGARKFEEQSRTTAGDDDAKDSFSSEASMFDKNLYEFVPDDIKLDVSMQRSMQGAPSTYMHTQDTYRNTKQVYDVPVVTNRGEHVMRSAGAGARDAGRCTDLAADDELLLWASKYADARALIRVNDDVERQRSVAPVAAPLTRVSTGKNRDLMYVFENYICKREEDHGVTVMLHDVPYRFQVDPDVFKMIETLGYIDAVDYIYLPMAVDRPTAIQFRNKGYCFIHFWDPVAAQSFLNAIHNYKIPDAHCTYDDERPRPPGKGMFGVMAKFQGLSLNLNNLLDIHSKKWRPKNGCAYVRTDSGLSCVRLFDLRNLAKQYAQFCCTSVPGSAFGVPLYGAVPREHSA